MTFDLNTQFAMDETGEVEGIWEDLGDGATILIARAGNPNYIRAYQKISRGIRNQIDNGSLQEERTKVIAAKIIAVHVILDWKGLYNEGKVVKYSPETAEKMLLRYPDFREMVWDLANDFARFRKDALVDDAKNS